MISCLSPSVIGTIHVDDCAWTRIRVTLVCGLDIVKQQLGLSNSFATWGKQETEPFARGHLLNDSTMTRRYLQTAHARFYPAIRARPRSKATYLLALRAAH
jgi:hypothetical protein